MSKCPFCHKSDAVLSWSRGWSSDGTIEYLGHVCLNQRGGCGKHFDSERAVPSRFVDHSRIPKVAGKDIAKPRLFTSLDCIV